MKQKFEPAATTQSGVSKWLYIKVFIFGRNRAKYFKEEYEDSYFTRLDFPGYFIRKIPCRYKKYIALNERGKQLLQLRFKYHRRLGSLTKDDWVLSQAES